MRGHWLGVECGSVDVEREGGAAADGRVASVGRVDEALTWSLRGWSGQRDGSDVDSGSGQATEAWGEERGERSGAAEARRAREGGGVSIASGDK